MQRLMLKGCMLLPQGERAAAAGVSALLATLAGYKQLQWLKLSELSLGWNGGALAQERFAALTASPALTSLEVLGEYGIAPLPDGALQHMFAPGQKLPLRELVLLPTCGQEREFTVDSESCCMTGAELHNICSSCPELQFLHIIGVVNPGDMSGLLQLTFSCTELCIGGPAMSDADAPVVRQLVQLKVLRWWNSPWLTDVGVEQLTALTRLTRLDVRRCESLSWELGGHHHFYNNCLELRSHVSVCSVHG